MSSRVQIKLPGSRRKGEAANRGSDGKNKTTPATGTTAKFQARRTIRPSREEAKWKVEEKWAPSRRLTTPELGAARRLFFEIDKDGSGSIDAEELGQVMRQLGQNPTEAELNELIKSVDEGDADGKIQLREFLTLYTRGLDTKTTSGAGDAKDAFVAMGGDPRSGGGVSPQHVHEVMLAEYDLDVDIETAFMPKSAQELQLDDFEGLLLTPMGRAQSRLSARPPPR